MKLISTIGYAIVVLVGATLVQARARYLERESRRIRIDPNSSIVLRAAKWVYTGPVLALCVGSVLLWCCFHEMKPAGALLYGVLAVFMVSGGIWWFSNLLSARVIISDDKLIFTEGNGRREIRVGDVSQVSIYWFSFEVKLQSGKTLLIPATFESSQITLAFLRRPGMNKVKIEK